MSYRHALILQTIAKSGQAPRGVCPLFVPQSKDFLGVYPLSHAHLRLPSETFALATEAQLAVFAELEYDAAGRVEAVIPRMAGAFVGASVGEAGMKWSVRKQWGAESCALAQELVLLKDWAALAELRLMVKGPNAEAQVSVDAAYPWLGKSGQAWLAFALNEQADGGAFERLSIRVAQAERPPHALIALGAFAPEVMLQAGEGLMVEVGASRLEATVIS